MPNIANMNIGIGANLGRLEKGLNQAQRKITSFASGVDKTLGGRLGAGLQNINTQAVPLANNLSMATTSASGANKQFRNMNNTIGHLGYAIQDAPFAVLTGNFASIGNNLPQIIQGINEIETSSGTLSSKLQQLGKNAFKGPLGVITVANLATAALTLLPMLFRDTGEEAEKAEKKIDGLVGSLDRILELRSQFGEFEDDPFGLDKSIARREEIDQLLAEQENKIERINRLEREGRRIEAQRVGPNGAQRILTEQQENRLAFINAEIKRLGTAEGIQERITKLEEERSKVAKEIDNTLKAMTDEDVIQAEKAEQKAEASERQLKAQKAISELSIGVGPVDVPINEVADGLERIASMPDIGDKLTMQAETGSLADLQMRLQAFRNMRSMLSPASSGFQMLDKSIENTQGRINAITAQTAESSKGLMGFAQVMGNIFQQAALHGKGLLNILENIAKQLAAKAFVTALGALLTGGSSLGGKSFLSNVFGGSFANGGKLMPGQFGIVGEEGPEPIMATPSGAVIAPNSNLGNTSRVMGASGSGSKTINVPVYLNGRQIALAQGEYNDKINR